MKKRVATTIILSVTSDEFNDPKVVKPDANGEYACLAMDASKTEQCEDEWHKARPFKRKRVCPSCNALGLEHV